MFRFAKLLVVPAALLVASGCVVYADDHDHGHGHGPDPVVVNYAPYVDGAEAGVFWDGHYHDDVWYFDAVVDDPDGVYDVVEVWADVYDERSGHLVESFELAPTSDPYVWYAEYLGSSTWLDPFYRNYSVDFIAYDSFGDVGVTTVWAWTY